MAMILGAALKRIMMKNSLSLEWLFICIYIFIFTHSKNILLQEFTCYVIICVTNVCALNYLNNTGSKLTRFFSHSFVAHIVTMYVCFVDIAVAIV